MAEYTRKRKLRTLGLFWGRKSNGKVYYTSQLERSVLYLLEYAPQVTGYSHRPFTVQAVLPDGKVLDYQPNFILNRSNRNSDVPVLLACFDAHVWSSTETEELTDAIARWAEENVYDMVMLSSDIFDNKGLLYNLKLLWKYRDTAPNPVFVQVCRDLLKRAPDGMMLGQMVNEVCRQNGMSDGLDGTSVYPYIYNLLFRHILLTDILVKLGNDSPIYLNDAKVDRAELKGLFTWLE